MRFLCIHLATSHPIYHVQESWILQPSHIIGTSSVEGENLEAMSDSLPLVEDAQLRLLADGNATPHAVNDAVLSNQGKRVDRWNVDDVL